MLLTFAPALTASESSRVAQLVWLGLARSGHSNAVGGVPCQPTVTDSVFENQEEHPVDVAHF